MMKLLLAAVLTACGAPVTWSGVDFGEPEDWLPESVQHNQRARATCAARWGSGGTYDACVNAEYRRLRELDDMKSQP